MGGGVSKNRIGLLCIIHENKVKKRKNLYAKTKKQLFYWFRPTCGGNIGDTNLKPILSP